MTGVHQAVEGEVRQDVLEEGSRIELCSDTVEAGTQSARVSTFPGLGNPLLARLEITEAPVLFLYSKSHGL